MFDVLGHKQGGGGYGDGLMSSGEHRPAVGAAFGDVERFVGSEQVEHRQVVDAAL